MCTWVSVLVYRSAGREFSMERCLSRGCPLSPLLFNLVVEVMPTLVYQFEDNQWLKGMCIWGVRERNIVL